MKYVMMLAVSGYLGLCVLTTSRRAGAEPHTKRETKVLTLGTSLVTPFFGAYYAEANLRLNNSLGLLLNGSYFSLDEGDWSQGTATIGAGMSYHWQGEALRGWYLEAQAEAMFTRWRYEPSGLDAPVTLGVSGTGLVGYRFLCELGPMLDLGAGVVALHFPRAEANGASERIAAPSRTKVYPAVKVAIGWAF